MNHIHTYIHTYIHKHTCLTKNLPLPTGLLLAALCAMSAAQAQDAAPSEPTYLEEITVTVDRREQSLQDYAGAAQAISQEDLLRDGIGSEFRNLSFAVPGLNIANQEGNLEIFLRGVGSANNTELGDPAISPYINGVYIPRARALGSQFYDIERVEINKGPQGTVRGRNAVGGSVNIITRRPRLGEVEGYAQADFGTKSYRSYQGALNVPLGDTVALRLAGFSENHDSYFNNVGNQTLDAAGVEDELAGRVSVLFEPNERLSIYTVLDYVQEGGTGYPGAQLFDAFNEGFTFEDVNPRNVVYRGTQGKLDNELWGITGTVIYDFGPLAVEYIGSYREMDFNQTNASNDQVTWPGRDTSAGAVNYDSFSTVYWQHASESNVHELRLYSSADDARLNWTAGFFYYQEDQNVGFFSLNDRGVFYSGTEFTMPVVEAESKAGYLDAIFDLSDKMRLRGGVRYTDEEKSRRGIGGNWTLGLGSDGFGCCFSTRLGTEGFVPAFQSRPTFEAPDGNAAASQFLIDGAVSFGARDTVVEQLAGVVDGSRPNGTCVDRYDTNGDGSQACPANGQHSFFQVSGPSQQVGDASADYMDWRIGFEYDLADDKLLYAIVSTGTKAGGFNDNLDVGLAPTFSPEEVLAYEIGSKNIVDLGGKPVLLNASAFFYDYSDQVFQSLQSTAQFGADAGFSLLNQNVANSEILGVEVETAFDLPADFNFAGNLLFLDAQIKSGSLADVRGQDFSADPSAANIDLKGNKLPLTSKINLVFRLQQELSLFNGQLDWQLLANYRSSYHLSVFNEDDIVRPEGSTICGSNDAITCGFEQQQKGFWTLNLNARYRYDRWQAEFYATNLLDTVASQKVLVGNAANLRFLNLPRTFGLRLRVDI